MKPPTRFPVYFAAVLAITASFFPCGSSADAIDLSVLTLTGTSSVGIYMNVSPFGTNFLVQSFTESYVSTNGSLSVAALYPALPDPISGPGYYYSRNNFITTLTATFSQPVNDVTFTASANDTPLFYPYRYSYSGVDGLGNSFSASGSAVSQPDNASVVNVTLFVPDGGYITSIFAVEGPFGSELPDSRYAQQQITFNSYNVVNGVPEPNSSAAILGATVLGLVLAHRRSVRQRPKKAGHSGP